MDKQFDGLSKSLAEGVSRREALKKFGIGLAGILLAAVGLSASQEAEAAKTPCTTTADCKKHHVCCSGKCVNLSKNKHNCGACGNKCGPGASCVNGTCFRAP